MPRLFKIGQYLIFFWSNENNEPIHVHVAITPSENATKVWLTKNGGCIVAHNKGRIPQQELYELLDIISTWKKHFNVETIGFYC